jgi:hypothetical protein
MRKARTKPMQRATAMGDALPPVARARTTVSACSPSVALRSTLGYMLSPALQAYMVRLLIQ